MSIISSLCFPSSAKPIHRFTFLSIVSFTRGAVTAGYGLLHPRMAVELESAVGTDFARIYAGQGGTDPYGIHCSELYMDRYDCGGFAGKGILDIDAMLACCDRSVPEKGCLAPFSGVGQV